MHTAHVTRQEVSTGVPRWGMDYFFLGREPEKVEARDGAASSSHEPAALCPAAEAQGGDRAKVVLNCLDQASGAVFPALPPGDGCAPSVALEGLKFTGRTAVICLVDQERSIKALADLVQTHKQHATTLLDIPRGSSQSAGGTERASYEVAKQMRAMRSRLEEVYTTRVDLDSAILPRLVCHAGRLITHFQVKVDGKTPYERLRHRPYQGEEVEFGETVHYKDPDKLGKLEDRWFIGAWLGKCLASDERYVGTERGMRRCRSIWRRPGALP